MYIFYLQLLSPVCTVHYNRAPVTSATPHNYGRIKTHSSFKSCSSHPMRLNTHFQTRLNASYTDDHAVVGNDNSHDMRSVADSSLVHSPQLTTPHFFTPLTIDKITHFSATYIFCNYCTYLHNKDYSNCQPHHTVQIFVLVSTTVLTTTTTHNTALGTTAPNAPHFLCPEKAVHKSVNRFMYLMIDQ